MTDEHPAGRTAFPGGETVLPVDDADPERRRSSHGSFFRELPFLVLVAFLLALLIKAFLVQAFYIPSGSMEQTLAISDRVLVNKLVYRFRDVHRGEIVVFNGEGNFGDNDEVAPVAPGNPAKRALTYVARAIGVGPPTEKDFIKRVVAVGGDRVACCVDGKITVQPPGGQPVPLNEPYLYPGSQESIIFCDAGEGPEACPPGGPGLLVPEGRIFVLGDHRDDSRDSRYHLDNNKGTVPVDHVIGRAFVIVWPGSHATVLHVPDTFSTGGLAVWGPARVPTSAVLGGAPLGLGLLGALPVTAARRRRRAGRRPARRAGRRA
jgi:signal peptidase I